MAGSEVPGCSRFLKVSKRRRAPSRYLGIIYVLFVFVLVLCINSIIITSYHNKLKSEADAAAKNVEKTALETDELLRTNKSLKIENKRVAEETDRISKINVQILEELNFLRRKNEELARINQELVDDNIALQNSLKMAASAGIKPQNYTEFEGLSSRGNIERGEYIGQFHGTAYTPSTEECGNNMGITNSGKPIIPGVSVAVDKKCWPFGTVFYIKGLGYAVAMDTGSAIKGKYRFDFSVFNRDFARALGSRKWEVYLIKMGDGKVESGTTDF